MYREWIAGDVLGALGTVILDLGDADVGLCFFL